MSATLASPIQWRLSATPLNEHKAPQTPRPSGHSQADIPAPIIVIPARLRIDHKISNPPVAVCDRPEDYLPLQRIFPKLCFIRHHSAIDNTALIHMIRSAIIVLDPLRVMSANSDLICVAVGVNFIGPSDYWSLPPDTSVVKLARSVLTDHLKAHRRFCEARLLARKALGIRFPDFVLETYCPEPSLHLMAAEEEKIDE
jgi:hypothetical protein